MTIDSGIRKELLDNFGNIKALESDEIVEKLITLKKIFNLSSEDLYIKWEQYVNRAQKDLDLTLVSLDDLQQYLQSTILLSTVRATPSDKSRDYNGSSIKRKPIIRSSTGFTSSPTSGGNPVTPNFKKRRVDEIPIESSPVAFETANNTLMSSSPKFSTTDDIRVPIINKLANQQSSNSIVETLNPHIEILPGYTQLDEDPETAVKPFKLGTNFDPSKYKFRTMSMKLLESADVLDEQIDLVSHQYQESTKDGENVQFENPCISTQSEIICCGRIVPDSPMYDTLANQSLNDTSLYLETSRLGGIGQRIPLNLSKLLDYSLFPGQIVVLKGRNPTGRSFVVEEIMKLPELGAPLSTFNELFEYEKLLENNGLKCLVAAGPFSNQHNLNYTKLENLVEKINKDIKPHAVILYGPFIDMENNSVISGDIELPNEKHQPKSLDELFKKLVTPILRKINSRIQVILVPSLRDSTVKHVSYPQDSFDRKIFGLPKNVKIFPNPSSFFLNEVLIGGSNLDVFKDLRDVYKASQNSQVLSNRFDRISHHIFEQRRYYPIFPGSIKRTPVGKESPAELHDGLMAEQLSTTSVGGSSLEVPYLGLAELGDSLPDVLIAPSDLKNFAKVIKGVVVINPGSFIRPNRDAAKEDGSYVLMNIKAPIVSKQVDDNVEKVRDDLYYNNVYGRCRVDIYKS